jgi:hypothetical protein
MAAPSSHPLMAAPAPPWSPTPTQPPPVRDSPAVAIGLSLVVLLVVLAIAATTILLVANGGSSSTGILTQSTPPNSEAR